MVSEWCKNDVSYDVLKWGQNGVRVVFEWCSNGVRMVL
jgi:hypothetical protein